MCTDPFPFENLVTGVNSKMCCFATLCLCLHFFFLKSIVLVILIAGIERAYTLCTCCVKCVAYIITFHFITSEVEAVIVSMMRKLRFR